MSSQPNAATFHSPVDRKLGGLDMINPGPGYLDVGTMQSPLGLSAEPSNLLPQMSPFMPRPGPPKPVHIDLAEPVEEVYKKHVMTSTQKGLFYTSSKFKIFLK